MLLQKRGKRTADAKVDRLLANLRNKEAAMEQLMLADPNVRMTQAEVESRLQTIAMVRD